MVFVHLVDVELTAVYVELFVYVLKHVDDHHGRGG